MWVYMGAVLGKSQGCGWQGERELLFESDFDTRGVWRMWRTCTADGRRRLEHLTAGGAGEYDDEVLDMAWSTAFCVNTPLSCATPDARER